MSFIVYICLALNPMCSLILAVMPVGFEAQTRFGDFAILVKLHTEQ